uniref:Uncharacterized protein n=1 Tax=Anguilla anguilla TaxID=7936 RepID=A0A0E9RWK8_ANGAN
MMAVSEWAMFLQSCGPKRADSLYFYCLFFVVIKVGRSYIKLSLTA